MGTGKVEYAPDYKSKRKPKYPEMTERFAELDRRHERLRLERAVIEAAKAEYQADEQYRWRQARRKAVKVLLEFESSSSVDK